MKRLAAVVLVVGLSAFPLYAQRGGAHGGSGGSHGGGFSGSHMGGFSGARGGFSSHGGSSFQGGFHGGFSGSRGPAPGRIGGPPARPVGPAHFAPSPRFGGGNAPRVGLNFRYGSQMSARSRPLFTDAVHHRGTYHSPFSGDHRGRDRDRDRDHDRDRDRFRFFGFFGPTFPLWGWGYPYAYPFLPDYWDTWDDYDSQPNSNYAAAQSYPEYAPSPYGAPGPERYEQDAESYQPWPYSKPAASSPQPAATSQPSVAAAPVTVVFKDGRPSEQIYNYMLTPKTLSVLDQHRHDIPVDQIDLAATARVNHQAGIEFALPGGSR